MLSEHAETKLEKPVAKFTVERLYTAGLLRAHRPLLLNDKWLIQSMPPVTARNDSSRYELRIVDLQNQNSRLIAEGNFLISIARLSENQFVILQGKELMGLGSSISIYQVDNFENVTKSISFEVSQIAEIYADVPSRKIICLQYTDDFDRTAPTKVKLYDINKQDDLADLKVDTELSISYRVDRKLFNFIFSNNQLYFTEGHFLFRCDFNDNKNLKNIFNPQDEGFGITINNFIYYPESESLVIALSNGSLCFLDKDLNKTLVPFDSSKKSNDSQINFISLKNGKHFLCWDANSTNSCLYAWDINQKKCVETLKLDLGPGFEKETMKVLQVHDPARERICIQFSYHEKSKTIPDIASTIIDLKLFAKTNLLLGSGAQQTMTSSSEMSLAAKMELGFIKNIKTIVGKSEQNNSTKPANIAQKF